MKRRTLLSAAGGLAVLGVGGFLGVELFAPERATRVTETREGSILSVGQFVGKDNHRCSGTVELRRDDAGAFVQFRDYDQTQGPDVFCYLTPEVDPDTAAAVAAGTKVLIDGGADGGEMTKTGTFSQALAPGVDVEAMRGVAIWCDRFSVPFGAATLTE